MSNNKLNSVKCKNCGKYDHKEKFCKTDYGYFASLLLFKFIEINIFCLFYINTRVIVEYNLMNDVIRSQISLIHI